MGAGRCSFILELCSLNVELFRVWRPHVYKQALHDLDLMALLDQPGGKRSAARVACRIVEAGGAVKGKGL
jgi:hypothetical protein